MPSCLFKFVKYVPYFIVWLGRLSMLANKDILFVGEVHHTQMGEGIYFSIENILLYSESTTK